MKEKARASTRRPAMMYKTQRKGTVDELASAQDDGKYIVPNNDHRFKGQDVLN